MKFSKADHRRIMDAFEDFIQDWTVLDEKKMRQARRVFAAMVTRSKPAPWRESADKHARSRKLPLK
jgi:hypothetical protein